MNLTDKEVEVLQGFIKAGGTLTTPDAMKLYGPTPCESMAEFGARIQSLRQLRDAGYLSENITAMELSLNELGREVVKTQVRPIPVPLVDDPGWISMEERLPPLDQLVWIKDASRVMRDAMVQPPGGISGMAAWKYAGITYYSHWKSASAQIVQEVANGR